MIVNVKENGWKYTPDEKVIIVINGMQNVVSQVANRLIYRKHHITDGKMFSLIKSETYLKSKIRILKN